MHTTTVPDIKSVAGNPKTEGARAKSAAPAAKSAPRPAAAGQRARRRISFKFQWTTARKLQVLVTVLLLSLAAAATFVYLHARQAARNATAISTATEMQMLSQRIANSAQQAAQGSPVGFEQLVLSRDQFVAGHGLLSDGGEKLGVTIPESSEAAQVPLREVAILWRTIQGDINLLVSQKDNLIALKEIEGAIARSAPTLAPLVQELAVAVAGGREAPRSAAAVRQLQTLAAEFDPVTVLRKLSTETPDSEAARGLNGRVQQFRTVLDALLGASRDTDIPPLAGDAPREKAEALGKAFTPFAAGVQTIVTNLEGLGFAKQSGRDIFTASEDLLKVPVQLVEIYQQESAILTYYIAGAVASALLALACLMLLGKVFLDDARRRARESELENKRNQEAILRLLDEMGRVADGDLTAQAKVTEDVTGAIADSINYTIEELRRLVSGITRAATQVAAASGEAQAITGQLLQASQKQSDEIQSTGQSVVRMAQSISEVSNNAAQSASVAKNSLVAAGKGAEAVQNAVRGMNDIRNQIQETSKRIKRLGESSQEIGEIVQLITDITEQTNVLALNAAIQAAAAGEAGRGFSIVAEEVQRLAERSAEATKHISAIVRSIQSDTQDAVEAMERSTQEVVDGTRVADEAGQTLQEIGRISRELEGLISSISRSAQEQSQSATRVAASMKGILGITQLTTEGTRKTATSTAQLNALANELKHSVAGFKLA